MYGQLYFLLFHRISGVIRGKIVTELVFLLACRFIIEVIFFKGLSELV